MIDQITSRRVTLREGGTAGPYIIVSLEQLGSVESILMDHQIRYWLDESSLSVNGGPEVIFVNLGREHTTAEVQPFFDAVG